MSGGGTPEDHSVELEKMRQDAADRQRTLDTQAANAEKVRLAKLRNTALVNAGTAARSYFSNLGVDPNKYASTISEIINSIAGGISETDTNPGSYYKDVGARAYESAQNADRARASSALDDLFAPNLDYTRLPETYDDPYLAGINAEQRATAEEYLNNLRARGVITETGYQAGEKNLDTQAPGVMARLNEIGTGTLETGRQGLRDVIGRARTTAGALKPGQQFNAATYSTDLDRAFTDFVNNLGQTLRGKVTGNLYDTSGLATIAGSTPGGASPQAFDPAVIAGLNQRSSDDDEDQKNRTGASTGLGF